MRRGQPPVGCARVMLAAVLAAVLCDTRITGQPCAERPVSAANAWRQPSDSSARWAWVLCVSSRRLMALRGGSPPGRDGCEPKDGGSQSPLATAVGGETPTLQERDADALVSYARLVGAARGSDSVGAAGDALRRALALNPANMDAATAYARVLHLEGRVAEALQMYRTALLGREPPTEHAKIVGIDGISTTFPPDDGDMSELVHQLIKKPTHNADALAGFAGLLLSHPTLALQEGKRRNRDGTKFEIEVALAAGRSILLHAIALAPSSPACADGMRDLVFAALQHRDDDAAAKLVQSVSREPVGPESENSAAHSRESTMLLLCLQQHELRVKTLSHQHARAVAYLHAIQKQYQVPPDQGSRQRNEQTCLALRQLCLCTHTECSSSRTCAHFGMPSTVAPCAPSSPRARFFAAASAALANASTALRTDLPSTPPTQEQSPARTETATATASTAPARAPTTATAALVPPQTDSDALIDLANDECDMRVTERLAQMHVDITHRRLSAETHAAACLRWSYGELVLRMGLVQAAEASFDVALSILPGFRPALLRCDCGPVCLCFCASARLPASFCVCPPFVFSVWLPLFVDTPLLKSVFVFPSRNK